MRLIFACFILFSRISPPRRSAAPADAALPATHATAIANALKGLPKQRSLSADDRKQAEDLLNQAQADETQADELARQWQTLRETADAADDTAAKIDAALAQDDSDALDAWKKNLPVHASTDQLETMLATERSALTAAHSAVTALDAEMRHQSARPAQMRDELTAAYASADAAQTSAPHKGESAPLASARTLRAQAAERLATVQIALLELENRSYEPRMRLLSSQLRQRQRTIGELNAHVSTLEAMVLNRTDEYVDTLRTRVMQQAGQMPPNAHTARRCRKHQRHADQSTRADDRAAVGFAHPETGTRRHASGNRTGARKHQRTHPHRRRQRSGRSHPARRTAQAETGVAAQAPARGTADRTRRRTHGSHLGARTAKCVDRHRRHRRSFARAPAESARRTPRRRALEIAR